MLESKIDFFTPLLSKRFFSIVIRKLKIPAHVPVVQKLQILYIELFLEGFGLCWGAGSTQATVRVQTLAIRASGIYLVALKA